MAPFLDIFGKRKTKKERIIEKPKVEVDYREKNSLVGSSLVSLGMDVEFKELKIADYLVKGVAIERKTISDFISSIKNKRLQNQLEELKQYPERLLIVEGAEEQELYSDNPEDKIGMHPNAIRGLLLSILLKHKIPIIFTKNAEDTAKFIAILAKKQEKETSLNVSKKTLSKKQRLQFILEGFPGIGPKTAKKLLKEYKTLSEIFNAPVDALKEKIGKKAEIFELLKEKY